MTQRPYPGMVLTSPDALDRLPVGARVRVEGAGTFVRRDDGTWLLTSLADFYLAKTTTDDLLTAGPVTVTRIPGDE